MMSIWWPVSWLARRTFWPRRLIAKKREAPRRRAPVEGPPLRRPPPRPEDKGGVLGEFGLSEEQGNEIIMAARAHWFEDEEPAAEAPVEEAAGAESSE
jgi:N utilization substance protein A